MPKLTPVAPVKLVPVMVTEVAPAVVPDPGETPVTVGAGGGVALEAVKSTATEADSPVADWMAPGLTAPETVGSKATMLPSVVTTKVKPETELAAAVLATSP